ncbi:MAG TPA: carboxypeptidase-like regulatory domain-containing protein [Longimicrobium sp.]|nr:carboxypeptidase-like regulatory domain-containing protein [Longimicrobium sp.]
MTDIRHFREARRPRAPHLAAVFAALLALAPAASLPAQGVLQGRVVQGERGVAGAAVELHRVTPGARGVAARATSGADGSFRVTLPPPDTAGFTVFFATAWKDGVRYFGRALHPEETPGDYRIAVFDTTASAAAADSVRVTRRDVFFIPAMDGGWEVAELVRVRNQAGRTLVSADRPVVGFTLPAGVASFESGSGDAAADSARGQDGGVARMGDRVWVTDPLVPGERDFFFRYRLGAGRGKLALPLAQATDTLNLYVRQPSPEVDVAGLLGGTPFEAEGERFLRYSGQDLRAGAPVSLDWSVPSESPVDPRIVAVALAGLILAGGAALAARRRPAA